MLNDSITKTGELAFQVVDEFSERHPSRRGAVFPVGQLPKQCWYKNGSHKGLGKVTGYGGRGRTEKRKLAENLLVLLSPVPRLPSFYFFAKIALLTFGGDIGSSIIRTPAA